MRSLSLQRALRPVALLIVLAALSGCSDFSDFEERAIDWHHETAMFIRGRVTFDELQTWLREQKVSDSFKESGRVDGNWRITVERVYPKALRCEFIDIVLHVQVDESQVIQSFYYDFEDDCYW